MGGIGQAKTQRGIIEGQPGGILTITEATRITKITDKTDGQTGTTTAAMGGTDSNTQTKVVTLMGGIPHNIPQIKMVTLMGGIHHNIPQIKAEIVQMFTTRETGVSRRWGPQRDRTNGASSEGLVCVESEAENGRNADIEGNSKCTSSGVKDQSNDETKTK